MPVLLPEVPALAQVTFRLVSYRVDLTPTLGGPVQRVNRIGSRYAIDLQLPSLDAASARLWVAARLKAEVENDVLQLHVPEVSPDVYAPVIAVDGAGQAGTALAVKNLAPGRTVRGGSWFSFDVLGRKYLHQTTSDVAASSAGKAVLTVAPMLRASPADGQGLYTAPALMEGLCDGTTVECQQQLKRWSTLSFTLTEAR